MRAASYVQNISVATLYFLLSCGTHQTDLTVTQEHQITHGRHGHTLNHTQIFSPDDQWIVFDTRNDDTHISRTCCIKKVNVVTGEVVPLYNTTNQSVHGPGVGAAAWNPRNNKIIFIHGLLNCNEEKPYGFSRRFGAIVDANHANDMWHAEARAMDDQLLPGALRGGTHAHSWSGDGEWISFTYNDFIMGKLEAAGSGAKDLRTIGVMSPVKKVTVPSEDSENFSGQYFSVVAATVTEHPRPGSDEIEKAFDECWVGKDGYLKSDGTRQKRAIAFQGHLRDGNGALVTEVFVADIPEDITASADGSTLQGTVSSRPVVPKGQVQRRLTFTADRKFPGLQGPRCWLRSSPDGATIYFLMKDDDGIVQVWSVPVKGGKMTQVTRLPHAVESQFNLSPDGKSIVFVANNSIWITNIMTGKSQRIQSAVDPDDAPVGAIVWNHSGDMIAYNRYVESRSGRYLQIFTLQLN